MMVDITHHLQSVVRAACPFAAQHGSYSKRTGAVLGPNDELVRVVKADGSSSARIECQQCRTVLLHEDRPESPKEVAARWVPGDVSALRKVDTWGVRRGTTVPNPPCGVDGCDNLFTQLHHYGPQAIFGRGSDNRWPTGYLCVAHHTEWHTRMDGYVWQTGSPRKLQGVPEVPTRPVRRFLPRDETPERMVSMKEQELRDMWEGIDLDPDDETDLDEVA